jgi:ferric-dicitrate binding protein FerR (iron transport regulator)
MRALQDTHTRAAEWALRVDAAECSAFDWRELERWLATDGEHRVAFENACALWAELDEVAADVVVRAAKRARTQARGRLFGLHCACRFFLKRLLR